MSAGRCLLATLGVAASTLAGSASYAVPADLDPGFLDRWPGGREGTGCTASLAGSGWSVAAAGTGLLAARAGAGSDER